MHSSTASALSAAFLVSTALAIGPDCVNGPLKDNKICDLTASPRERAEGLVSALEIQEKLDNLVR
jgi:beta-D-xylosidase 4